MPFPTAEGDFRGDAYGAATWRRELKLFEPQPMLQRKYLTLAGSHISLLAPTSRTDPCLEAISQNRHYSPELTDPSSLGLYWPKTPSPGFALSTNTIWAFLCDISMNAVQIQLSENSGVLVKQPCVLVIEKRVWFLRGYTTVARLGNSGHAIIATIRHNMHWFRQVGWSEKEGSEWRLYLFKSSSSSSSIIKCIGYKTKGWV